MYMSLKSIILGSIPHLCFILFFRSDLVKKCIFIAGVHGVGKTTFSRQLATKLNLAHYSASKLIKDFDSKLFFADKRVNDVRSNQDVLINSIQQNVSEEFYILDGHFTLLTKDNVIEKIPSDTFKNLSITTAILLLEIPSIIHKRIHNRDKSKIFSVSEIEEMQQYEIAYAKEICSLNSISLLILKNSLEVENYLKKERVI